LETHGWFAMGFRVICLIACRILLSRLCDARIHISKKVSTTGDGTLGYYRGSGRPGSNEVIHV